jgi:hypothetical protein
MGAVRDTANLASRRCGALSGAIATMTNHVSNEMFGGVPERRQNWLLHLGVLQMRCAEIQVATLILVNAQL